jgi:rod shape-determining protein MreD
MNGFFFVLATLFFILLQTVLMPAAGWSPPGFDLMMILVLFLSLHVSHHAILIALVCIGAIMDSLSGGPFFLFSLTYIWIYIVVQLLKSVVFQTSSPFIVLISLTAMVIHQGLVVCSVFIQHDQAGIREIDLSLMVRQVVWGTFLIPPGVWLISMVYRYWCRQVRQMKKHWHIR